MTLSVDEQAARNRLPILGTMRLASSLADRAPGKLIILVMAQVALLKLGQSLVDQFAPHAWGYLPMKAALFVVEDIVTAIMTGAIVTVAHAVAERRRRGLSEALGAGALRFWPILAICAAMDLLPSLQVPFSGLAELITMLFLVVSTPVCMIERLGPIASLSRSVALTRGSRGQIFGIMLVGGGIVLAGFAAAAQLYYGVRDLTEPQWLHGLLIVVAVFVGLPGVVLAVVAVLIAALLPTALYLNLRFIETGHPPRFHLDEIASPTAPP